MNNNEKALYIDVIARFSSKRYMPAILNLLIMFILFSVPVLVGSIGSGVWLTFSIAYVFLGLFQYYALIATHEAIHYGLWPDRKINDFLGTIVAWIHSFNFTEIKKAHLEHHRMLGKENDPDFMSYVKDQVDDKFSVVKIFSRPFSSITQRFSGGTKEPEGTFDKESISNLEYDPRNNLHHILMFHAFVACALGIVSPLLSFAWFCALMTIPGFLMHVRLITEHSSLVTRSQPVTDNRFLAARTHHSSKTLGGNILFQTIRFVIAPFCFNYHHEHHAMPSIPYYNLFAAHNMLKQHGYFDNKPEVISDSYVETIRREFKV